MQKKKRFSRIHHEKRFRKLGMEVYLSVSAYTEIYSLIASPMDTPHGVGAHHCADPHSHHCHRRL